MTLRPVGDSHPQPVGVEEGARRCPRRLQWAERGWRRGGGWGGAAGPPRPALQPPPWPQASLLTRSTAPHPGRPTCSGPVLWKFCSNPPGWRSAPKGSSTHPTCRQLGGPNLRTRGCGSVSAPGPTAEAWLPEGAGSGQWGPEGSRFQASWVTVRLAQAGSRGCLARSRSLYFRRRAPPQDCGGGARSIIPWGPPARLPDAHLGEPRAGRRSFMHKGQRLWAASPHPTCHPHKVTWTRGGHTSGPPSVTSPSSGCREVRRCEAGKRSRPPPHSAPPWGPQT